MLSTTGRAGTILWLKTDYREGVGGRNAPDSTGQARGQWARRCQSDWPDRGIPKKPRHRRWPFTNGDETRGRLAPNPRYLQYLLVGEAPHCPAPVRRRRVLLSTVLAPRGKGALHDKTSSCGAQLSINIAGLPVGGCRAQ